MLSLVIPTYNERRNIELLLTELHEVFQASGIRAEVIVVDDGSPDGTGEFVEEHGRREPSVRLVRRAGKLGLTSAVVKGFESARGDILGVMDADLSHPASALPALLSAIEDGADFVIGSRYIDGGRIDGWPLGRRIVSRTACLLARPFSPVKDPMSGFFLIRRRCLTGVEITAKGFKIVLDLLVRASYSKVSEVPIRFVDRRYGESKISGREVFSLLRNLASYAIERRHAPHEWSPPCCQPYPIVRGLEGGEVWRHIFEGRGSRL
jgi:dolichol-phosphate mannosyltransferase